MPLDKKRSSSRARRRKKSPHTLWSILPLSMLGTVIIPMYFHIRLLNSQKEIANNAIQRSLISFGSSRRTSPQNSNMNSDIVVAAMVSSVLEFQAIADALEKLQNCPESEKIVKEIQISWDSPLPIPTFSSKLSPFMPLLSPNANPPLNILPTGSANFFLNSEKGHDATNIIFRISNTTIMDCSQWKGELRRALKYHEYGSVVEVSKKFQGVGEGAGKPRTILETACAPIGDMRPEYSESNPVPGTAAARNVSSNPFDGIIQHEQFQKDGYIGPFQTSLTKQDLMDAVTALKEYRRTVFKARNRAISGMSESEVNNYHRLYGKMHVNKERCYAYDARCRRVAEDPAIVSTVKSIIGEDVVVYTIDLFAKGNNEIQPWHTDLQPYDRCYGKNVQLWLAVEGVTANSSLQIMTGSHHMPSSTWLFPEHLCDAKTIDDKHQFEQTTLRTCAEAMDPTARILSPVVEDGTFMIIHSNLWHASENSNGAGRSAIRIYYTHPECQPPAAGEYSRPDIPPLEYPVQIASVPPSLLVSGNADTWPNRNRVVHNFLHFADIPAFIHSEQEAERWVGTVSDKASLVDARSWSPEDVSRRWRTTTFNTQSSIPTVNQTHALLFNGQTPFFKRLDLEFLRMGAHEALHGLEHHRAPDLAIVVEGSVKIYTIPKTNHFGSARVADLLELLPGSAYAIDGLGGHCPVGGPEGGTYFGIKFDARKPWREPRDSTDSKGPKIYSSPLDGTFLDEPDFMQMLRVVGKVDSCVHDKISSSDRETVIYVQYVPSNMTMLSVVDGVPLTAGSVLYYPSGSTHGIEAEWNESGEKYVQEYHAVSSDKAPTCLWFDFISKSTFNEDHSAESNPELSQSNAKGDRQNEKSPSEERKTAYVIVENPPSSFIGTKLEKSITSLQLCEDARSLVEEVLVAASPEVSLQSSVFAAGATPPVRLFNDSNIISINERDEKWVGETYLSLISINESNDISCHDWANKILNNLRGKSKFYIVNEKGSRVKGLFKQENWERSRDLPHSVQRHLFSFDKGDSVERIWDEMKNRDVATAGHESENSANILFGLSGDASGLLAEFEVALKSILLHRPSGYDYLNIHVMADSNAVTALRSLLGRIGLHGSNWPEQIVISVYNVDHHLKKWRAIIDEIMPVSVDEASKRHTIGTYFRLFADDVLPDSVTNILYMDTDVIIMSDLNSLFHQVNEDVAFQIGDDGNAGFMLLNVRRMKTVWELAKMCKLERMQGLVNYMPDDQLIYRSLYVTAPTKVAQLPKEWAIAASNVNPLSSQDFSERWPTVGMLHFNGGGESKNAYFDEPHPHMKKFPETWGASVTHYLNLNWEMVKDIGERSCDDEKRSFVVQFH